MTKLRSVAVLLTILFTVGLLPPQSFARNSSSQSSALPPADLEMATGKMTPIGDDIWVAPLGPGLWVVTSVGTISNGAVYPANDIALESMAGTVLVDPGWTGVQANRLVEWARANLGKPVVKAVATHSHSDRLGGIDALAALKIPMLVLARTREIAEASKLPNLPEAVPGLETRPYVDPAGFELFYPGPGHAPDNIVVYFPAQRVVFGGCLIKSATSKDLGNLADAVMAEYPSSVERVARQYPDRRVVVPGHGTVDGDPIAHTLELLRRHSAKPEARTTGPTTATAAILTRAPNGDFHARGGGFVARQGVVVSSRIPGRDTANTFIRLASSEVLFRAVPVQASHQSDLDVYEIGDTSVEPLVLSEKPVRDGDRLALLGLTAIGETRIDGTAALPHAGAGISFRADTGNSLGLAGGPVVDADGRVVGVLTQFTESGGVVRVVPAASITARLAGLVEPGTSMARLTGNPPADSSPVTSNPPPPPNPRNYPKAPAEKLDTPGGSGAGYGDPSADPGVPPQEVRIATKARVLNSPRPAYTEQARLNPDYS